MIKLGILISGRGSNMAAILSAISRGELEAEVTVVISNNPNAMGLSIAQAAGILTVVIDPKGYSSKDAYEAAIVAQLQASDVDWVVLAGYMRIVGETLLSAYANRMINIHPSLLPAFKGLHAQQQALDAGVRIAGCTTHFVNEHLDGGAIVLQAAVPVLADDTVLSLSDRILAQEHPLLIKTLQLLANDKLRFDGHRVIISD